MRRIELPELRTLAGLLKQAHLQPLPASTPPKSVERPVLHAQPALPSPRRRVKRRSSSFTNLLDTAPPQPRPPSRAKPRAEHATPRAPASPAPAAEAPAAIPLDVESVFPRNRLVLPVMSFPRRTSPWDKALARLKHVAASPSERAKFDFFAPAAPFGTVYELLDAKDGNVRAWAAEFLLVDPDGPQDHAAQAAVRSRTRQLASVFKSQTSMDGKPLPLGSTRYLDEAVLAMHGSSVVQDTAIKLKLLPRDLEIMLFHAYADFDIDAATNPHALPKGASLISAVQERMIGDEAETLLEASQAIFWLRRFEGAAKKLGRSLNSLNLALPNHKYRIPVLQMLVSLDAKVKAITSDELFRKESDRLQRVYSALLDMSGAKTPPNG